MKRVVAISSMIACVFIGSKVRAEDQPLDDQFLVKAAEGDHAEVQAGKLAQKHAANPKIKEFGGQLVQDHQKNYDKLATLMKNRNVAIVSGTEKQTRDELDRLGKLDGVDFDREFIKWAVDSHKKTVALFENQAKNGKNADTRAFASESLPGIREHLKHAEELAKNPQ